VYIYTTAIENDEESTGDVTGFYDVHTSAPRNAMHTGATADVHRAATADGRPGE
jgi:hypothetical protein